MYGIYAGHYLCLTSISGISACQLARHLCVASNVWRARFLQDYDNSSSSVDWATNPLGYLGFYQASSSVSDILATSRWYRGHLGTLTPLTTYVDLLSLYGTQLAISYAGRLRLEHVFQNTSVASPTPHRDPPAQGAVQGLVSVGLGVRNASAAASALKAQGVLLPFALPHSDGTTSVWARDTDGVLVEFVGPV